MLCPQRQGDIKVEAWFVDAANFGEFVRLQRIQDPVGDGALEKGQQWGVTAWGDVTFAEADGGEEDIQVAQIDCEWYVCEN